MGWFIQLGFDVSWWIASVLMAWFFPVSMLVIFTLSAKFFVDIYKEVKEEKAKKSSRKKD